MEGGLPGTPSSLPSLIPNTSSSSPSSHVSNDEVSVSSFSSYFIFSEFGRSWVQRFRDVSIGGSSDGDSAPLAVPYTSTTFRVSIPSAHPSISDPDPTIHSHEPRVLFSFADSPTLFSSDGESSSVDSLSYFSPGPFPGGYVFSPSSSPFVQPSEEEVHLQEEERSAALVSALEEGLQGLSEGVFRRGYGEGGVGSDGAFSQGEVSSRG